MQPNQLDPAVLLVVNEMPDGAISNPIQVPGGLLIVTLHGKREIGQDLGTVLTMRQLFLPFTSPLNPQEPTAQQRQTLDKARKVAANAKDCAGVEAAGTN